MKNNNFSFKKGLLAAGIFLLGAAAITGCSKSLDTNYQEQNVPVAGLMSFNLTTDKTVGVSISGNSLTTYPLSFSNYTGDYQRIYTGSRSFEARDGYTGNILATTPYTFDSSHYYSAFVLGANGAYKSVIANDNFDSLSGTNGQAYIRYINAVPDSVNAATVKITANGTNVSNGTATYGTVSAFAAVAPGQVNIAISKNGVTKDRPLSLEQQKVYTILLLGVPGSNTADSMQVRYITNGTLSGTNTNGRTTTTNARSVSVN